MGRPTNYTQDTANIICERIVEGESLRSICTADDMPAIRTVFNWLAKDDAFVQQYTRAREAQADTLADEIIDIADDGSRDYAKDKDGHEVVDHDHIARARLRVDSRKWIASKLKPKKYGEKVTSELSGLDGGPVQVVQKVERVLIRANAKD